MTSEYFPNYWLMYGPPAPADHQLVIFKTKSIAALQNKIVSLDGGKSLNKHSRSALSRGAVGAGRTGDPNKPPTFPRNIDLTGDEGNKKRSGVATIEHNVTVNVPSGQDMQDNSEEGKLKRVIEVLQGAGKRPDGAYVLQDRITEYSTKLADMLINKLLGNTDSSEEYTTVE